MRSASIPEGWQFLTSDPTEGEAWATAVAYKRERERLRRGVFVRVKVIRPEHVRVWWVLKREEPRTKA